MAPPPSTFTTASASATGQLVTAGEWLDAHSDAAQLEHEAQLRMVDIRPGWFVLDAGCGSGRFLPWLAELVGPGGLLAALDMAPDNVARVDQRLANWPLRCRVETRVGNVLALPYPDDAFDAVWFANTAAYLSDAELRSALDELRRVVRPGGLVAIKEIDATLTRFLPAPPGLMLRFRLAWAAAGHVQTVRQLRAPGLPGWLRRAGLVDIRRRSTLIERAAPLDLAVRACWRDPLLYWARVAAELDLPAADQDVWARFGDPAALEDFLDDPDCALVEGNILAVGTVPDSAGAPA